MLHRRSTRWEPVLQIGTVLHCAAFGCQGTQAATSRGAGPGGELTTPASDAKAFAQRAPNTSLEQRLFFNSGLGFYQKAWLPAPSEIETRAGLGPLYNAAACVECHAGGGRGRPPLTAAEAFLGLVLRVGTGERGANGAPVPHSTFGQQLQTLALPGARAEGIPRLAHAGLEGSYADGEVYRLELPRYRIEALARDPARTAPRLSPRVAPATIGLGLLEAIPAERLHELSDPDDLDQDGVSGRPNQVWDHAQRSLVLGRFGWKAEQPQLRQQIAAALAIDLGITSAFYPDADCAGVQVECAAGAGEPELAERALDRLESYLRLLAVPARRGGGEPSVLHGEQLFEQLGCAACHVPQHVTAATAALRELERQSIWPYTDLLLHDLGPELADELPSFGAEPGEWRTPPLWGLGLSRTVSGHERLLHDGRADGVAEAILWHGGEAAAARDAFRQLASDERQALVDFVESL